MIDLSNVKGAIFDIDGTVLDSMWKWQSMESEYLVQLGVKSGGALKKKALSMSQREVSEYLQSELGVNKSIQTLTDEQNALMEPFYFKEVQAKPGAVSLLKTLHLRSIKMCVATATEKYLVAPALVRLDLSKYFGKIFTCGDEQTTKTLPDIFIRAAQFLGTDIDKTIVFEDALHAIKSAKAAGFIVAAVYDASMADYQEQIRRLADYYFMSWEDVKWM
ncbi:MAG: HAD family phosphatase [Oscillospiraceae bacterium]|nr:HAD family phosphatase [Oscillospiraceae bacterium]